MVKAVFFDIGGTLFNSDSVGSSKYVVAAKAVINYLKKHNINLKVTPEKLAVDWKDGAHAFKKWSREKADNTDLRPDELVFKYLLKTQIKNLNDANKKKLVLLSNHVINTWKACGDVKMRPDVPKMLNDLTKSGYKLGVISNTDSTNFVIYRLIDNNIYKYFPNNLIFMSCVCKKRKPAKDIFIVACEEAGVKPNEMVYVGDTISRDVAGSRNAGIKACVRINSSLTEKSDKGIKAGDDTPYVVKSLSELPAILKKINAAKK